MTQPIQAKFLIMEPTTSAQVPNNALFIDQATGNKLTSKGATGQTTPIVGASGSGTDYFIKQMQAGALFPAGAPLSKRPDGTVEKADSDTVFGRKYCAYALEAALAIGDMVNVMCVGPNIPGALVGLGMVPGAIVFISQSGTYTSDPTTFTDDNDDFIQAGIADCAAGAASTVATDLISLPQVIARAPTG